ncbi:hypothetical protein [Treponema primitia]|uniref:hypothetical protein n=1 Tax=Treponema primitia TaxID=88058 RepID=UPI0002555358|nr:hypothetical protein [Treponema primitia]
MGQIKDREAYTKVTEAFKRQQGGVTVADIVAKTALPLNTVRELVPRAADEYSARLQVTESGEILYSFPRGFTSKYRGFKAGFSRFMEKFGKALKIAAEFVFKIWIMVMLVGYFVLFMVIALGSLVISVAASNSNNRSSNRSGGGIGGMYFASSIFNMIIRIWFYSELTKSMDRRYGYGRSVQARPKGRPLYKAIFSFVFGDGDPNADWPRREKQAVIAYIQANRGVISLPEFMTLTGNSPAEAEERITGYCAEFGGLPEASDDGTVVYRFDELLLRVDKKDRSFNDFSAPIKRLFSFSSNTKKMNGWFGVINAVNLLFGGYFLINAFNSGAIVTQAHFDAASYLYGFTYILFSQIAANPLAVISIGLGVVPLVFSLLFWLIPGLRYLGMKGTNETIKLENLRKSGYRQIWDTPLAVRPADIAPKAEECRPKNMAAAQDRVIKEIGSYAVPDVTIGPAGETVYTFKELEREKNALKKYRSEIKPDASALGKTVFDSE